MLNETPAEISNRQKLQRRAGESLLPPVVHDYDLNKTDAENGDEINLREYLQRVRRHKWLVLVVTLVLTSAAAYYLYQLPRVYQAETVLRVDSEKLVDLDGSKTASMPFEDRAYYNTQLEMLESPALLRGVIKKFDLENNQEFLTDDVKKLIAAYQPSDSQTASMLPDSSSLSKSAAPADKVAVEAERVSPLVEVLIDLLNVQPVQLARLNVKDTRLISIKFKHANPRMAALLANGIADQLVDMNLGSRLQINTDENNYLQNNIADLKQQIRRDEEQLLSYGQNYQLPTQDDKQNTVIERLVGLNRQLLEAENDRKIAESAYRAALAPGAAESYTEMNTKPIGDIDAKLDDLRQRRAQLLVEVTEKYPDVQEIDKQIAVLEKAAADKRTRANSMYKTSLETRYRQALSREEAIRKSYDEQQQLSFRQNGAAINYRILQQSIETNRKILGEMQQREQENELLKAKTPNNIRVLDYATAPAEPLDQKKPQYLGLAFLFSLGVGIAGALLRDHFDDSVYSPVEVEKTLSLPALASIPQVRTGIFGQRRKLNQPAALHITETESASPTIDAGNELLINNDTQSPLAEAFRQLRTVLTLSPEVGQVKKLLVTSSRQGEGKTTTAVNIAVSLAQDGAAVVLIDADLRHPRLYKIFNLSNEEGLSELLTENAEPESIYKALVKYNENFYILPSGKPLYDCAENLGSKRMQKILNSLEPAFDYIVIDSPPVSVFADSAILAARADGVLLVVQEKRNSAESLRQTRKLLNMVSANIVGIVLNKVEGSWENYGYRDR
jgi:capsular exopolysaccharide synthesis family protein